MNQPPPLFIDQRKIDSDHLTLLSVFHFVAAGLSILGILFLFAHYSIFRTVISNPQMWQNQRQGPGPAEFVNIFSMLRWVYLVFGIWFLASGVLNVISGIFIRARTHRMFSVVVSALNCVHIPFGTALGVFTIIVLMRDSVREVYIS